MIFRPLCIVTGVFAVLLGLLLVFAPQIYLSLYVVSYSFDMAFAAQRLAPAIVGVGGLLLLVASQPPGPFGARFAFITAFVWLSVAATGVFHFSTGVAGVNILVAGAVEVVLGALFVVAGRQMGRV